MLSIDGCSPWTLLNSSAPSLPHQSRKSEWGEWQTSASLLVTGTVSTMCRASGVGLRHCSRVEAAVFLLPCHTPSFGYILWGWFVHNSLPCCKVSLYGALTRTGRSSCARQGRTGLLLTGKWEKVGRLVWGGNSAGSRFPPQAKLRTLLPFEKNIAALSHQVALLLNTCSIILFNSWLKYQLFLHSLCCENCASHEFLSQNQGFFGSLFAQECEPTTLWGRFVRFLVALQGQPSPPL